MSFINPAFFWFSPFVALPVIIHFLNKPPTTTVEFPTVRFLLPATRKVLRKFKLLHLLLLLLRIGFISFLIIAFARPLRRAPLEQEDVNNLILIDSSYSMAFKSGRERALERAKNIASVLAGQLPGQFAVAEFNRRLHTHTYLTQDSGRVKNAIENISLSPYHADYAQSLRELDESGLTDEHTPSNIIILSDFNRGGFSENEEIPAIENSQYMLIEVSEGNQNTWVEEISVETTYENIPLEISAVLRSNRLNEVQVNLYLQGDRSGRKDITLSGEKEISFRHNFPRPGEYSGWIEVTAPPGENRLEPDSIRYFTVTVKPTLGVVLVDGRPGYTLMGGESYFIERALSPRRYPSPASGRVVTAEELKTTDLQDYDIVYLLDIDIDEEISEIVTEFSRSGGGVGIFAGDNSSPGQYNSLLRHLIPLQVRAPEPVPAEGPVEITDDSGVEDVFSGYDESPLQMLLPVTATPPLQSRVSIGGKDLLFKYPSPDGLQGPVAFFAAPPSLRWGDFPLSGQFPVFIHKLTEFLGAVEERDRRHYISGQHMEVRENSLVSLQTHFEKGPAKADDFLPQASFPGIYTFNDGTYAVNLMGGRESELEETDEAYLREKFPSLALSIAYSQNLEAEILKELTGEERSSFFLILAASVLVSEEFLRKYLRGKKKRDET